jgi:hypothetical protein
MTTANPNAHVWTNAEVLSGTFCLGSYNYYMSVGAGYTSFGNFAQSSGPTGLPVELINLQATPVNNQYINVEWATSVEVDNQGFELQRSADGVNFEALAWIDGAGNSLSEQYYTYDDRDAMPNVMYYYRLKQVDFNQSYDFTPVVQAMLTASSTLHVGEFFPNPSFDFSQIQIVANQDSDVELRVFNSLGQLAYRTISDLHEGVNTLGLNLGDLPAATYQVELLINEQPYSRRLVVTR